MSSQRQDVPGDVHDADFRTGTVVAVGGLIAAWTAAGAAGLLGHPLRHAITALGLGFIVLAVGRNLRWQSASLIFASLIAAAWMTASPLVPVNVVAVALVLAAIATSQRKVGSARRCILLAGEAVLVLAIYHLARTSIPLVWQAADSVGRVAGNLAAVLTRHRLWTGATAAGLDYLVVGLYLAVMGPIRLPQRPAAGRLQRHFTLWAAGAVLLGQLLYLAGLSFVAPLVASLPEPTPPDPSLAHPPVTTVADAVRHLALWNSLLLAMLLQTAIAAGLLWILTRFAAPPTLEPPNPSTSRAPAWGAAALGCATLLLSALLPVLVAPTFKPPDVRGKKIVIYEKGFLNWLKPEHGQYGHYSVGMYGMLPIFLESLGARAMISPELSESDLSDADALILLYPDQPWSDGQLERIWEFVHRGGSLLVMGEHTVRHADGGSRFNDVLRPTAMRVRFDSTMFAVGGWLQSYEAISHATTAGIEDTKNDFGVVIGASLRVSPPARPVLVGRWGWADPGNVASDAAMMGNGRYDAGEKLGDLVLAAEQRLGKGKIVVFGDTSSLTNGINLGCHAFTSRLVAYLADTSAAPVPWWRLALGLFAASGLVVLLSVRAQPLTIAAVGSSMCVALTLCTASVGKAYDVLPDGRSVSGADGGNKLAYVDASHLEAYSRESWRDDGVMGLCLTLMRDGYLSLLLPELTAERLMRARLLISIAPARGFSPQERAAVKSFVRDGGIFILTAGGDAAKPSQTLLSEFGFHIGVVGSADESSGAQIAPLGHFKAPYLMSGDAASYVRFHAAWPISSADGNVATVAYYPPDKPLILVRREGRGKIAVVGDTGFAMNKNLEKESGEPFEGLRENADFWRWFLAYLADDEAVP